MLSAIWPSKSEFLSLEDAQKEQCLHSGNYEAAATPYSEWETKNVKTQIEGCWPLIAEMHMKAMISLNPDPYIFSYTEKH